MQSSKIDLTPQGPWLSRTVVGVMRLNEWGYTNQELLRWLQACVDLGVTTIDHADIYGGYSCEALFGQALALQPALRQQLQLITKCNIKLVSDKRPDHYVKHYDTSKRHIIWSAENSLKQLQTNYLDLLLIHRSDPLMNADEVAEAFVELKQSGKVLHFGVSNFTPRQVELLASRLDFPLVTNQVEISVMHLNALHDGTLDQCQLLRMTPMAWSPLGGRGLFTSDSEQAIRLRQALYDIGQTHQGATIDQVALAWLLKHPVNIIPVLGTGKLTRIKSAVAAEAIQLSQQEWFTIWTASTGQDVP